MTGRRLTNSSADAVPRPPQPRPLAAVATSADVTPMGGAVGGGELGGSTAPDADVESASRAVAEALVAARSGGHRSGWLEVVAACQALVNTATAVQDAAVVEVARREQVWNEDGTLGEVVHLPGRVAIDAADLVAPGIGASHAQAERRIEQAVRLAANRTPVEIDDRDLPERSGLVGLHTAMKTGHLDAYRAGVVAYELELAPLEVADAVVTALQPHLADDDGTDLRRRTRRLIARICPDLLRQRAERARAETGLRRWVGEPGVDEWHGTFPSEDAAMAWAAIDKLAHDLVAAGTCTHIEQARGKALTDLVTGNATIEVQVVLTTSVDSLPLGHDRKSDALDSVAAQGHSAENPTECRFADEPTRHRNADGHGAGSAPGDGSEARSSDDSNHAARVDKRTDGGTTDDPSHTPADDLREAGTADDLVQVQGARPSEPLLVRRGWLLDHLAKVSPGAQRGRRRAGRRATAAFVPCDPLTGARLDPRAELDTEAYRPGEQLAALVRARDGHCRFPGCSVAARFCDLDHVRPWPTGPTAAANLICLCRRHHRIKQRPGWSVRLLPDGRATWTDPTGRARTTAPLDALATLVLRRGLTPDHRPHAGDRGGTIDGGSDRAETDTRTARGHSHGGHSHGRGGTDGVGSRGGRAGLDRTALTGLIDGRGKPEAADPTKSAGLDGRAGTPERGHSAAASYSALETHLEIALEHHVAAFPLLGHVDGPSALGHRSHRRCTSAAQLREALARRRRSKMPDAPPF